MATQKFVTESKITGDIAGNSTSTSLIPHAKGVADYVAANAGNGSGLSAVTVIPETPNMSVDGSQYSDIEFQNPLTSTDPILTITNPIKNQVYTVMIKRGSSSNTHLLISNGIDAAGEAPDLVTDGAYDHAVMLWNGTNFLVGYMNMGVPDDSPVDTTGWQDIIIQPNNADLTASGTNWSSTSADRWANSTFAILANNLGAVRARYNNSVNAACPVGLDIDNDLERYADEGSQSKWAGQTYIAPGGAYVYQQLNGQPQISALTVADGEFYGVEVFEQTTGVFKLRVAKWSSDGITKTPGEILYTVTGMAVYPKFAIPIAGKVLAKPEGLNLWAM